MQSLIINRFSTVYVLDFFRFLFHPEAFETVFETHVCLDRPASSTLVSVAD